MSMTAETAHPRFEDATAALLAERSRLDAQAIVRALKHCHACSAHDKALELLHRVEDQVSASSGRIDLADPWDPSGFNDIEHYNRARSAKRDALVAIAPLLSRLRALGYFICHEFMSPWQG